MFGKDRKRVLVFIGQSNYNVLRQAAYEISEGFVNKGYQVDFCDLLKEYPDYKEINSNYSFIFSCNALMYEDDEFMQNIHIPYLGWLFDDPVYHINRIMSIKRKNAIFILYDHEMIKVVQHLNPKIHTPFFLPCGGFSPMKSEKKEIEILFPAVYKMEELNLSAKMSGYLPFEKEIIENVINMLQNNQLLSIREAIEIFFRENEIQLTNDILIGLGRAIICVDEFYRHSLRRKILLSLLNAGFKIHLVGELNEELLKYESQIVFHPSQDINGLLGLIGKSKIVISPQLVSRKGISERIPTALLGKALCFSPITKYLMDEYQGAIEPIYLNNLDDMVIRIQDVLKNYEKYSNVINDNYTWAVQEEVWSRRGERIVDIYRNLI